jgi:hypothetical protein
LSNRRQSHLAASALAAVASVVGASAVLIGPVGAAGADGPPSQSVVHESAGGYLSTITSADGDQTSVYAAVPYTATSTTDPGSSLGPRVPGGPPPATEQSNGGQLDPPSDITKDQATTFAADASQVTVEDELQAMGAPASIVSQFSSLDTNDGTAATTATGTSAVRAASAAGSRTPWTAPICASKSSDGGRIKLYGCDATYKVGTSGAVWYLQDKFIATGTANDSAIFDPDDLTGVQFGVRYRAGNSLYNWAPTGRRPTGKCITTSESVTYVGVTTTQSSTECPQSYGLQTIDATQFTTKWDGDGDGPSQGSRSTTGVDSVHNGATASPYPSLVWRYWWT